METSQTQIDLPFRVIPLKEAKGFTNREIPDFLQAERGQQMKKFWENVNSIDELTQLTNAINQEHILKSTVQYYGEDNSQYLTLDQAPEILVDLLGSDGRVVCESNIFRHKSSGLNGTMVFRSTHQEGEATVVKEVMVGAKINKVYDISYKEHAVIGDYEASRTTELRRGDINDNSLYSILDDRSIRYPSRSEVDVYVAQDGDREILSRIPFDEKLTWVKLSQPGEKVIGAIFNGDLPTYFDELVPKLDKSKRATLLHSDLRVKRSSGDDSLSQLFPVDRSLF